MSFEGRKMETYGDKVKVMCPKCNGKGTTGNSPNNARSCDRCGGTGKIKSK